MLHANQRESSRNNHSPSTYINATMIVKRRGIDDAVAQQQLRQPVPAAHQITADILAGQPAAGTPTSRRAVP